METITFYSYKGGVGRTLALANTAVYLSRFNLDVCIVDFDLEAPGLHYKLQQLFPGPIKFGLVDYIHEFTSMKRIVESLDKFVAKGVNIPASQGNIHFIPAGNVLSSQYWQKLAAIDWHGLFYKEGGEGIPFFLELKEKIRKEVKPDFLLIDSRTGITEMSGICTSLLPDKVVFLITNNPENIEGSRQILRGIHKAKRLKGQKPIEVNVALTRIPSPQNDQEIENERRIIQDLRNFLNEKTDNLDDRLNISEITVIHSDRELELAESLRLNQTKIKDIPLAKDYLKLFARYVPERIIKSRIDSILENIITSEKLLDDPDQIQDELEALIEVYPLPHTFKKIIDFYFLRNIDTDKILAVFTDLWKTSKRLDKRMYSKYIKYFMNLDAGDLMLDHLEIVEGYLEANPADKFEVELRLADVYYEKEDYKKSLKHYLNSLDRIDEAEETEKVLMKIFEGSIKMERYKEALRSFEDYYGFIASSTSLKLRIKALEVLHITGKSDKVKNWFESGLIEEDLLFKNDPVLFFNLMEMLGRSADINSKLQSMIYEVLETKNKTKLLEVGRIFLRLKRIDEFLDAIPEAEGFPNKRRILHDLERGI